MKVFAGSMEWLPTCTAYFMEQVSGKILSRKSASSRGAVYRQRSPKDSIFYQVLQEHFPKFKSNLFSDHSDGSSIHLPDHVEAEFDAYLKCGLLEHGFVKMSCDDCHSTILVALS